MVLYIVENPSLERVGTVSPEGEAALRAVKGGDTAPVTVAAYLDVVREIHGKRQWMECDCQPGEPRGANITIRTYGARRYHLANRPNALVPHAEDCIFRRGEIREPVPRPVFADLLNPFSRHAARHPDGLDPDEWPLVPSTSSGVSATQPPNSMSEILRQMLQTARLNMLASADRFTEPGQWLAEIRRAAERLYIPPRIPASEFLLTDPESWRKGEVQRKLDAAEADWPEDGKPFAFLCWPAHAVGDYEINPDRGGEGYVRTTTPVVCPTIFQDRVSGPYLFLGAVTRSSDRRRWECARAFAQPIVARECPIPVESDYERRALGPLRGLVRTLENNRDLARLLGGAVRVEIEKPLTRIVVAGGPCLPDFLVTVARPGAYRQLPGGPGIPANFARFDPWDRIRYVIEVMGFDNPEYRQAKEKTHPRMKRIGRVFPMQAWKFDSRDNDLQRQGREIAFEIAKDLLKRWKPG